MTELNRLRDLVTLYLGECIVIGDEAAPVVQLAGNPTLTAQQQATLDALIRFWRARIVGLTLAEWQALQGDIDGLRTYQGLASPTLAQTVLAVKAQSRIIRALIRD